MGSKDTLLRSAYDYCRLITKEQAKNFYYAFLTLPPPKRRAIYTAYTFCRECDDIADEEMTLERKLRLLVEQRNKLDQCFAGKSQEPSFIALSDAVLRYDIPKEYLDEVINGVEMDLTLQRYSTFEDLRLYCYRVASVIGLICLQIFEYHDEVAKDYAVDLGLAMQLTNILRDVREDLQRGRIYLPLEDLKRFAYSVEELKRGVINDSFMNLMHFQVERARSYFENGYRLLGYLPRYSRPCPAILGGIYGRILDRIEESSYNVFEGRISLSSSEKTYLMLTTWLGSLFRRDFPPG